MASKFAISEKLLAYVLDLPEGARLGAVERAPVGDDKFVYVLTVTGVDWPEGRVELGYTQTDDGHISLTQVTPAE